MYHTFHPGSVVTSRNNGRALMSTVLILVATFLAAAVEWVEALTIVLAVGMFKDRRHGTAGARPGGRIDGTRGRVPGRTRGGIHRDRPRWFAERAACPHQHLF